MGCNQSKALSVSLDCGTQTSASLSKKYRAPKTRDEWNWTMFEEEMALPYSDSYCEVARMETVQGIVSNFSFSYIKLTSESSYGIAELEADADIEPITVLHSDTSSTASDEGIAAYRDDTKDVGDITHHDEGYSIRDCNSERKSACDIKDFDPKSSETESTCEDLTHEDLSDSELLCESSENALDEETMRCVQQVMENLLLSLEESVIRKCRTEISGNLSLIGTSFENGVVVYHIQQTNEAGTYIWDCPLKKRYSDFQKLYRALRQSQYDQINTLPPLPPAGLWAFLHGRAHKQTIFKREKCFKSTLEALMRNPNLYFHPSVQTFLSQ